MAEAQANFEAQAAEAQAAEAQAQAAERPREPSPPAASTHTQDSTHRAHHAHSSESSGHERFACPPTPALLGVRKNLGPYTIPPSPLRRPARCTDRR
jgi:hypothetical protein